MAMLRIHHPVPDFDRWKKAFDDDPLGREQSGVRRHAVYRGVDEPKDVWIDLAFDTADEAAAMLERLRALWQQAQGAGVIGAPQAHIVDAVEHHDYVA